MDRSDCTAGRSIRSIYNPCHGAGVGTTVALVAPERTKTTPVPFYSPRSGYYEAKPHGGVIRQPLGAVNLIVDKPSTVTQAQKASGLSRQASQIGAFGPRTSSRFFFALRILPGRVEDSMNLCYVDESGTSAIPGNTSHFILAGISIPFWHWKDCDREIGVIKARYALAEAEIHTGWIARTYPEQAKIPQFESLSHSDRRTEVERRRNRDLIRLQRSNKHRQYRQTKKNYKKTKDYIHLSRDERHQFLEDIAQCVGGWGFARLFAECIDKINFAPQQTNRTVDEQAFEQIVTRFEHYLRAISGGDRPMQHGMLIHDNNQTVEVKHTRLMKRYLRVGTFWTSVDHIVGTPLFVNSELTDMVQIADLCAYAIRRYLENHENTLFDHVFRRADRRDGVTVGVRHFTDSSTSCSCKICTAHIPGLTPVPQ